MKKFEFTRDIWENKKGDVIEMDMKIYHKFIHPLLMRGVLKLIQKDAKIREKVKEKLAEDEDIMDLNRDGKVDAMDASIAGRVLANRRKNKRRRG